MSLPQRVPVRNRKSRIPGGMTAVPFSLVLLSCGLLPSVAQGADFNLSGGYVLRTVSDLDVADPVLLFLPEKAKLLLGEEATQGADSHQLLLLVYARGVLNLGDSASIVGSLDTTALSFDLAGDGPFSASAPDSRLLSDGRTLSDSAGDAAFVREIYADLVAGESDALLVTAGKRRQSLLSGLLYDDYGVSTELQWDFASGVPGSWSLGATALLPQRTLGQLSPSLFVAGGTFSWSFRGLLSLESGALWMRDRATLVPGMMRDMLVLELMASGHWNVGAATIDHPVTGKADVVTLHTTAELDLDFVGLRVLAALQAGSVTLGNPTTGKERSGRPAGRLLLVELPVTPLPSLRIVPYYLRVSGSRQGQWADEQQLGSFVTLAPLFGRAAIFLGGQVDPALSQSDFRLLGLGARGVTAAGAELRFEPISRLRLVHSTSVLGYARKDDGAASARYGVELDTAAVVTILDWLDLRAEFDALLPGEFFPESDTMFRLVGGVEGVF